MPDDTAAERLYKCGTTLYDMKALFSRIAARYVRTNRFKHRVSRVGDEEIHTLTIGQVDWHFVKPRWKTETTIKWKPRDLEKNNGSMG